MVLVKSPGVYRRKGYAVTRVMVLTMPWPMVWQLKISKRQKWLLIGIFMLGAM